MIVKRMYFIVILLFLTAADSNAASFDCAKASTRSERLICADKTLQELDETLTAAYRKAYSTAPDKQELKAAQVAWLKKRDACETNDCLGHAYKNRIDILTKIKPDLSWLKEYAGKSTNALVWDKRFDAFLKSISPTTRQDFGLSDQNLAGALGEALGGPPDKVVVGDGRYLTFSACVYRFCLEKGFVWVDLQESTAIAALVHYDSRKDNFENSPVLLVFSRDVEASTLPQRFKEDLKRWLAKSDTGNHVTSFFIDGTGRSTGL